MTITRDELADAYDNTMPLCDDMRDMIRCATMAARLRHEAERRRRREDFIRARGG